MSCVVMLTKVGSEGKQNNQMSAKDMEAVEMAQELMSMEMYEEGMGYDQMKQLLQVIDESKNMAGIEPETRSSQESNQYSQEMAATDGMARNNSMHDLMIEERPKPNFSYRQASGRASPVISGRKSALAILPVEEMSVSLPETFNGDDPPRSGLESESLFDKLRKENNSLDKTDTNTEIRSQNSTLNVWHNTSTESSQNSQSGETNVNENVKSRKNQRFERWNLDPTMPIIDENDVPLKQKNRPVLNEKIPYRFCHNERIFQEAHLGDKVLQVLSHALDEVADLWRRKHRPDTSEFQWGSPIKVGTNNRNLDKKMVFGERASSPTTPEVLRKIPDSGQRKSMDRNCKRKAAEHIKEVVESQIDSGEDSDAFFEIVKKSKKTDQLWEPFNKSNIKVNTNKNLTRQEKMLNNIKNSTKVVTPTFVDEFDSDEFDNDDLQGLSLKNRRKKGDDATQPSITSEYPRRVAPPNPSKPKPRAKKNEEKKKRKLPVKKNTQAVLEMNEDFVINVAKGRTSHLVGTSDNRLTITLSNDEIDQESENAEKIEDDDTDVEVKPIPLKGLAGKLQQGKSRLLASKKAENRLEEDRIQHEHEKKAMEKMQREENVITRFLKENEERKQKEAREVEIRAKEEAAQKAGPVRDRERRRRQAEEKKRSLEAQNGHLLMDDDDGDVIAAIDAEQRAKEIRVQCPICLLEFSAEEIQDHAADCDQFDKNLNNSPGNTGLPADNDEVAITNDEMIHDCAVCRNYSTGDGIEYEQHVNECMRRQRNCVDNPDIVIDSPASVIVEVPSSPIRCFEPISELRESAINYAEQFQGQKAKPNRIKNKKSR